jgi:5-methylcytosine-specific restriction endonuclease McrA
MLSPMTTTAREFTHRLATLLRREHEAMADFLVALADFDERRLWAELGYSSSFSFLHRELRLSKGAAAYRKTAADLVGRYPEIAEALRRGDLCITSVVELAKVITPQNRAEVLPRFFGLSKRDAMEIVAELKPVEAPPRRAVVTSVAPAASRALVADARPISDEAARGAEDAGRPADLVRANVATENRGSLSHAETAPAVIEPLTADLRRYHVTVSKRFLAKLEAARAALSHSKPGATPEEILEAGLDLLLAQAAKRKAIVSKPRKTPPPSTTDRVPAHVKRAVWLRDGGRCQFPLASGGVCNSTDRVQLGHVTARARGGPPTVENVRCECWFHNQQQADRDFGKTFMDRFRRKRDRTG